MKINETIERNCCQSQKDDLIKYRGEGAGELFCRHCGQIWTTERYTDAAGGSSTQLVKVVPK